MSSFFWVSLQIYLCTGKHQFSGHKNQEYNLGFEHSVYKTRENLRLILDELGPTEQKELCMVEISSRSIGNFTFELPTMFSILKLLNWAGKPSFCMILAYFLAAILLSSSFLAPVQTILPS